MADDDASKDGSMETGKSRHESVLDTGSLGATPVSFRPPGCAYSMLDRYSEASARHKLARHRQRGDLSMMAAGCPGTDHWHVVPRED